MSEVLYDSSLSARVDVYQDNYGNWRWVALEGGEAVARSNGYWQNAEDAHADAKIVVGTEMSLDMPIYEDGASHDIRTMDPPPKIDAHMEALRGGYQPPQPLTEEQLAAGEAARVRLRGMQDEADEKARVIIETEKALPPDAGMGLDELQTPTPRPAAKARGKKDAAPVEVPGDSDPLARQVQKNAGVMDVT